MDASTITHNGLAENRFATCNVGSLTDSEKHALVKLALSVLSHRHRKRHPLKCTEDTREYLCLKLGARRNEVFGCLFLDAGFRIIEVAELFQGTIDCAQVHPRVVLQRVMACNAAAVVLFHNHPSGIAAVSQSDKVLTGRLQEALKLIDVRVLDHIVVAGGEAVSFAEQGLI